MLPWALLTTGTDYIKLGGMLFFLRHSNKQRYISQTSKSDAANTPGAIANLEVKRKVCRQRGFLQCASRYFVLHHDEDLLYDFAYT